MKDVSTENKKGLRTHPYIKREIKVCFSKNSRKDAEEAHRAKCKFDYIFGVHDSSKGLFDFGLSKEEKRQLQGAVGMANVFGAAIKAAKGEDALTNEDREKLKTSMNDAQDTATVYMTQEISQESLKTSMNDAQNAATGGMAVYSRRADEAQAKLS